MSAFIQIGHAHGFPVAFRQPVGALAQTDEGGNIVFHFFRNTVGEIDGTEPARKLTVQIKHTGFDFSARDKLTTLFNCGIQRQEQRARAMPLCLMRFSHFHQIIHNLLGAW